MNVTHPMFSGGLRVPNARLVTGRLVSGRTRAPITREDLVELGIPEREHDSLRREAHAIVDEAS